MKHLPDERYDIVYFPLGAAAFGGAERSILELAAAQQAAGRRVLVCHEAALEATDFVAEAQAAGLALQRVDWAPEAGLRRTAAAAWRRFRTLDAAIVHFNISWRPHMWLVPVVARVASGARLIGTMRAMPERRADIAPRRYLGRFDGPPLRALLDLLLGRIWARALHQTVSVNRDDYPPRLVDEYGFRRERVAVVYNGVRVADSVPSAAAVAAVRARFGVAPGGFVLGYVGRLSPEKGIVHAIEALRLCDPSVQLLIAGDGDERPALEALAERHGLAARVRFLGYCNEPAAVFAASDALVVPSLWNEAFGRVVVEAMGCGRPVIATRVGGMQELFDDGRQGFMIDRADVAAIAPAIARAVDRWVHDAALLRTMSAAARELALSRYSVTRVASEYAQLYRRLDGSALAGGGV